MNERLLTKRNIVVFSIIFLLITALIIMSIIVNDRTYKLSKKNAELADANGTISEYSSQIEEHKNNESELQSEIDKYKAENDSLKKQITELAAKKKAASEAAAKATNAQSANNTQMIDAKTREHIATLTKALSFPKTAQEPPKPNVCYLTFDDGPSKNTPAILDILKKYNAKATFFVIGTGNLDLLKRIDAEGHAIGLHSNIHVYSSIYSSMDAYLSDLYAISQKVQNTIGKRISILRFPGGSSNIISSKYKKGLMSELSVRMPNMGYSYFDWNVSSGDADKKLASAEEIISGTLSRSKGKSSLCILMHDAPAKTTTVEALPKIIEGLSAMGYKFEVLTPTTYGYHQALHN